MIEVQVLQGVQLRREKDHDETAAMFRNTDRYRAHSIIRELIDDPHYVPTHWEAHDIIQWRGVIQ